jgi:hypothetical protein
MREICLKNQGGRLGDNLLAVNFLRKLVLSNELKIRYACPREYHLQLYPFIEPTISLLPLEELKENWDNVWIAQNDVWFHSHPDFPYFHGLYYEFFQNLCIRLKLDCPVVQTSDVLLSHPAIAPIPGLDIDVLMLNCPPLSKQFDFDPGIWELAAERWHSQGLKIWTANKVRDTAIPSTRELGYGLIDIARLACHAKMVVSVCTGPLHAALNQSSIKTVMEWHVFHKWNIYDYPNVTMHRQNEDLLDLVNPVIHGYSPKPQELEFSRV